tara:strand:- start:7494 stop:9143 length:1650 start_codon:yes stop_codon:yes gene_type:complete
MVDELPGESMPDGIDVDDAAAYFGVTESSDMVHVLMEMDRSLAMEKFFEVLSDIVLLPGEFDFTAASERIQCEGGEIYYLVAGHLGIMTMPDPLLQFLGLPDSSGSSSGNNPGLDANEISKLTTLADPMKILKLLAVAYATGGNGEVTRYLTGLESFLAHPESNHASLVAVADELESALDVAGHALPVPTLASGTAASASVASLPKPSLPQSVPKATTPAAGPSVPLPGSNPVPLPTANEPALPQVELPTVAPEPVIEPALDTSNEKQVAKATQDAFAGAFDLGRGEESEPAANEEPTIVAEPEPVHLEEVEHEPQPVVEQEAEPEPEPTPVLVPEPSVELTPLEVPVSEEELFTSAAEHFIAADTDGSEQLSIEELAIATGTNVEEATTLHAEADTDGDGSVSLSEFMSSPAAEKAASLPRPVAPIRKPLDQKPQPQPQQPQQPEQPQQQDWDQQQQGQPQQPAQQQQAWNQQQQGQPQQQDWNQQQQGQPQQGWNQQQPTHQWNQAHPTMPSVQPTIRSGVMCRGCGIGLDPYWRFCPVCGTQNAVQ